MASDSPPANINGGPSSPNDWETSPIGNTFSSPGNSRRPKRGRRSSYATPPQPLSDSRFDTPGTTPPSSGANTRRGRGKRSSATHIGAATSSSTDDAQPSSEAGDADEDEAPPMYVWGTNISVQDVNAAILRFLRHFRENPQQIEGKYMMATNYVIEIEGDSLDVDAHDVFDYDRDLYLKMVRYPLEVLAIFDIVLMDMVSRINPLFEKHIQARIFNLRSSTSMRNLNPSDVEKMVSLKGMIIRCSSIIPEIREAVFRCLVCGYCCEPIVVDRGRINEPTICGKQECLSRNSMTLVHNRCRFADKQVVKLQETPDEIPEGGTPHTVSLLMHKLVDAGKPGDRVESVDHLVSTKKARTSESGASNTSSNQDASLHVDLNEEETRPMGHKASKRKRKRKRKRKMKSDIEGMTINLDNMFAKFTEYTSVKKVEVEMKQKQLEVEEMKAKAALAKVQLKEYAIFSKDTSQMTKEQLIIHEHLCEQIRGRWNM